MQWVRAACVRPAPSMRVCARSYLGRASIAKTVVDIFATTSIQKSVCLSICSYLSVCLSVLFVCVGRPVVVLTPQVWYSADCS